jgi:hypothetical protein
LDEASKKDLDGLGKRVNQVEIDVAVQRVISGDNKDDIKILYEKVSKLPLFIVGSILVPTVGIIYLIFTK